jgi:hypothetical protein
MDNGKCHILASPFAICNHQHSLRDGIRGGQSQQRSDRPDTDPIPILPQSYFEPAACPFVSVTPVGALRCGLPSSTKTLTSIAKL